MVDAEFASYCRFLVSASSGFLLAADITSTTELKYCFGISYALLTGLTALKLLRLITALTSSTSTPAYSVSSSHLVEILNRQLLLTNLTKPKLCRCVHSPTFPWLTEPSTLTAPGLSSESVARKWASG